jgi:hypothetical protein
MMKFKTESEMAAVAVAYFNDLGWEVYQEVQASSYSKIADIVAVHRDPTVSHIIECKLSMGLKVIDQAIRWKGRANYVSVCVPHCSTGAAQRILKYEGIGLLTASSSNSGVHEVIRPVFQRKIRNNIAGSLVEKQKDFALAGNANGRRWTPYQQTCRNIREAVSREPGIILKDLIASIDHHYGTVSSAKTSIRKWADLGQISGVRCEKDGKFLRFYADIPN